MTIIKKNRMLYRTEKGARKRMGMKLAIIETENNKEKRIEFENNAKGIGDFITLLNKELSKNNCNIRISKININ